MPLHHSNRIITCSYQARATHKGTVALKHQQRIRKEKSKNYYLHKQLAGAPVKLMTTLCLFNQLILDRAGLPFFFLSSVVHHSS